MGQQETLAPGVAWHIRSIGPEIRQHFVDLAHERRVTVAELLTQIVRRGEVHAPAVATPVDTDRTGQIIDQLDKITRNPDFPAAAARTAIVILTAELRAIRRGQRQPSTAGATAIAGPVGDVGATVVDGA